jgi:hypothetical protein
MKTILLTLHYFFNLVLILTCGPCILLCGFDMFVQHNYNFMNWFCLVITAFLSLIISFQITKYERL